MERVEPRGESGQVGLVLVTLVMFYEVVIRLIEIDTQAMGRELIAVAVHAVAAVVLAYLLWSGTPPFRLLCATVLAVSGALRMLDFVLTPLPGNYFDLTYGVGAMVASGALCLSRQIKLYLVLRENRRLGLSSGSS